MKDDRIKNYQKPYRNLYETLADSAGRYPDKTAVIDDKEEVTYRELLKRTDNLASVFRLEYQLKEQDQIGFLMVNSIKVVTAFYAAVKIGCVAVMINTKLKESEIADLLKTLDIKLIISDLRWLDKIEKTAENLGIGRILTEIPDSCVGGSSAPAVQNPENTAVIMHTSGTTGVPKGVMITHRNILEAAYGYQEVQKLDESDLTVLSVPLFHILGLSCVMTLFIYMGATVVLSEFYHVEDVLRKIKRYQATHFHSVPAVYLQIMESSYPGKDLSSLKTAVCGGAPISRENMEKFCEYVPKLTFHLAYGMTETAGSGTLSAVHKGALKAVPNVRVWIADSEHREAAAGEIGEIVFCGPCVATGRWQSEGLSEHVMYSGDVGYMDEEGHVYVIDRLKDIINRGGEKIFPKGIEEVILQYPAIEKAAVFAVSDKKYGEVPAAAVVPRPGARIDLEELKRYLKERVATFELPVFLETVRELPVTQNGKVQKARLRRDMEERRKQN